MDKTICINGILQVGDWVLSEPTSFYPGLVGIVTSINPVGSSVHVEETENPTDDVWVDFNNDYSNKRMKEILANIRALYEDESKTADDIMWDVIMSPSELIKLNGEFIKNSDYMDGMLNSGMAAATRAYYELLQVHTWPQQKLYSVYCTTQKNGETGQIIDEGLVLCKAWESACTFYAEFRERYRNGSDGWTDTSRREEGIFSGTDGAGNTFKVQVVEHQLNGGILPFEVLKETE